MSKKLPFFEKYVFSRNHADTHTQTHIYIHSHTHAYYLCKGNINTGFSINVPAFPVSIHNNTVSSTCYFIMHYYRLSFLKFILLKVNATQRSFFKKITKFFLLCTMIGHIKTHQKMKKKMGVTILFWELWGETVILDYEENTKIEKYDL